MADPEKGTSRLANWLLAGDSRIEILDSRIPQLPLLLVSPSLDTLRHVGVGAVDHRADLTSVTLPVVVVKEWLEVEADDPAADLTFEAFEIRSTIDPLVAYT